LKICLVTPFPPEKEGVGEYSKSLIEGFRDSSTPPDVTVVAQPSEGRPEQEWSSAGCTVKRIWRPNSLRSLLALRRFLRSEQFDVVHLQLSAYSKFGGLMGEPLLIPFFGLPKRTRTFMTLHSIWFPDLLDRALVERGVRPRSVRRLAIPVFAILLQLLISIFDKIILVSNCEGSELLKQVSKGFEVPESKLEELTHPCTEHQELDTPRGLRRAIRNGVQESIVCPGFLSPRKGLETLLLATSFSRQNRDIVLTIVGEASSNVARRYLVALETQTNELGLERFVNFETRISSVAELDAVARTADLLVLPNSYRPGPSGMLCHLTGLGVPIVTTADPHFLPAGSKSPYLIVPPEDPLALQAGIESVLDSKAFRESMSQDLLAWAGRHTFRSHAASHLSAYQRATSARVAR
jgi:glycosyltransferase involved in cell wall biosynthesis